MPSEHVVPSAFGGLLQLPVPMLHTPAVWHWSLAEQTTGLLPVQLPVWQVSVCVHPLPSEHAAPSGFAGLLHAPVEMSHAPMLWHWSLAAQTTALLPLHDPAWQVSVCVQALPSLQALPLAFAGLLHAPVPTSHVPTAWH